MKKQIQKLFSLHMLRPVLYRTLTFVAASACLAAIWNRCVNARGLYPVRSYVFPVLGVMWLILCWFCFLRMDRVWPFSLHRREKEPSKSCSSMVDYLETDPDSSGEYLPDEKTLATMAAAFISGILCLIYGLV
ncbi:MAG: hypothetical protein LUD41_05395 [Phascolarctobacterium sp.]|nr:hypothetical protein [Phascolarctobacterium sp.]